ncbi:MAG: hypothetical protein JW729_03900 [Bacteroidales bacterium]|nr:hypothetical protein [Bacteroidales bacterium]
MKKKLAYLMMIVIFVASGTLNSCNKVTDALDIVLEDFLYSVEVPMEVETVKSSSYAFGGSGAFDPSASEGDQAFGKIIKAVNLKSILIGVSTLSGANNIEIYDAVFTITDDVTNKTLTYQITEPTAIYPFMMFEVDPSTPNFDVLTDILKNLHPATISINGHINETEIALTFAYYITADITLGI